MKAAPQLHPHFRQVEEMTDAEIELLVNLGRRESELLRELKAAEASGDKDHMLVIAQQLCHVEEERPETRNPA
jgi:hypothetical protein